MQIDLLNVIIPLIPSLLTIALGIWKLQGKAGSRELDILRALMDNLREDNVELKRVNAELEEAIEKLKTRLARERRDYNVLFERVQELIAENQQLHQYIGELRQRMRVTSPEALDVMRRVASLVRSIALDAEESGCDDLLRKKIGDCVTLVESISKEVG